jgi:hypothetical protein
LKPFKEAREAAKDDISDAAANCAGVAAQPAIGPAKSGLRAVNDNVHDIMRGAADGVDDAFDGVADRSHRGGDCIANIAEPSHGLLLSLSYGFGFSFNLAIRPRRRICIISVAANVAWTSRGKAPPSR